MPVRTRPIQPSVVKAAYKLWYRMASYKVVLSKSPCASPIVIAPKATAPFWRICGDLGGINKFVMIPQDVISMNKELEKARVSSSLADLNMANALHELKLTEAGRIY